MDPRHHVFEKHKVTPTDMIPHLFLPKRLPQSQEPNLPNIELAILEYLTLTSETLIQHLPKIHNTLKTWISFQSGNTDARKTLSTLTNGNTCCFYVRDQNCTICFTKVGDNMRVITFRSSLPNELVAGTSGSVLVSYPETVDLIRISDLLLSDSFSKQLGFLVSNKIEMAMPKTFKAGKYHLETREPSFPFIVSEYLVGMLCPQDQMSMSSVKIQKKLRDQVNWHDCEVPFRRSGLWMSVKVVLSMGMKEQMKDELEGKLMYKIVVLEMLTLMGIDYTNSTGASWDVTSTILVKLSRRTKKLSEMNTNGNSALESLRQDTLKHVLSTVESIHASVSNKWENLAFPPSIPALEVRKVTHCKRYWINDCVHKMSKLSTYLNSERIPTCSRSDPIDNLKMIDPVIQMHTEDLNSLVTRFSQVLSIIQQDYHLNNLTVWIYQVETFVRQQLTTRHNCKNVFELLCAYSRTVFSLYGKTYSDPVYFSRMTITVLKLVAVLDEIAVERHPLLKTYKTGIQDHMFESLLIPEKCDMVLVETLQAYFTRRNMNASQPNWLGASDLDCNSFPVKFAEQNSIMVILKSKILQDSQVKIQAKREEIERVQNECIELQRQVTSSSCSYTYNSYYERNDHDYNCARCSVESRLKDKRKSVCCYQRPLPPEEYLQNAVVFELLIPPEIAYLRDGVCVLLNEILGHKLLNPVLKSDNVHTNWMGFKELQGYHHNGHQTLVRLGSQLKDTLTSHYGRDNPDVFTHESLFILENGLNCKSYKTRLLGEESIVHPFTLQLSSTASKDAQTYASLQPALNPKRPTENQVIAKQCSCHQNLNLKEFIAFGCIRCGHNIQVRNLYAAIASHVISLDKEPVLALIIQATWELGPGKREIYADFESEQMSGFCLEFLGLLTKLCDENATNWSNPIALLSLTIITIKILEMTESTQVKQSASKLLQKYRFVIENWCVKLEALIAKSSDTDKKEEIVLMNLLLKCSICSAFTFNVSCVDKLTYVFREPPDVTYYLKTLSRLHHLVIRENILKNSNLSPFIQNLLRHARVNIPLNLQEFLHNKFRDEHWNSQLHQFVCSKWVTAQDVDSIPNFHPEPQSQKSHAYQATYTTHIVCIDILRGTFFVDGFPPSLLPETIIRHPLYKSFFRSSKFRVQRDSRTFRTVDEYCGHHFEFTDTGVGLVVRQRNGLNYLELLPPELFKDQVSHDFINNFTHWFDSVTKVVYFRRMSLSDKQLKIEVDTDYFLNPTGRDYHLIKYNGNTHVNTHNACFLLSINSHGFKKITRNLQKLESHRFIHVHCEEVEDENRNRSLSITAKLWRFNMSFSLHHMNGLLYCDNYPDYYVSVLGGQSLETFVGLQSGVVLERRTGSEASGRNKLFVIQHGGLLISSKVIWADHQVVSVGQVNRAMRNPPYFVFEVDQVLNRLRPGNSKSAWLYLAALHAATSSPFPDPFTQLTGVESAMSILQSGFVWSCSPYDNECVETLGQIASFTPSYSYYPNHLKKMQTTDWPQGLERNSYAAYDGYAITVEKLIQDSSRLEGLFRQKSRLTMKTDMELCRRSYYRHINSYNHVAHLNTEFAGDMHIENRTQALSCYQNLDKRSDLVKLAHFRHQRTPSRYTETVTSFIMTSEPLPQSLENTITGEFLDDWFTRDLHTDWLQVYSLCKNPAQFEHEMTLMFGAMVYSGIGSVDQLLNLHNLSIFRDRFPEPVKSLSYGAFDPLNHEFQHDSIATILRQAADSPPSQSSYTTFKDYEEAEREYSTSLKSQANNAGYQIMSYWPDDNISSSELQNAPSGRQVLNSTSFCLQQINSLFLTWFNNLKLKTFVGQVDEVLRNVSSRSSSHFQAQTARYLVCELVLDVTDGWVEQECLFQRIGYSTPEIIVAKARQIFSTGVIEGQRSVCIQAADEMFRHLQDRVLGNCPVKAGLRNAGIHVRLAPVILLKEYVTKWKELKDERVAQLIGSLAVIWGNIKRLNRIALYLHDKTKYSVELARERETEKERGSRDNWKPTEHPEWLVLELELDISIRPIQEDVARHMMSMPGGKNGVMQLNMGEGKTSVIVPMVIATLAVKKSVMCRVTVLNSIFATNWNLLSFAIGGFLNRRVYTVPCSRDIDVSKYLKMVGVTYRECLRLAGVVITLPEYRLSFRLQMYNCFLQDRGDVGRRIYGIEEWLRRNARDVVDESDEVFSVKYQLIYTTGKQVGVGGGSMRWGVCQQVFELLPKVAGELFKKYGPDVVEFEPEVARDNPEQFTHFRILNDKCKGCFYELVADGILDGEVDLLGQILTGEQRVLVKEFLVNEGVGEEDHDRLLGMEELACKKETLLLVSGYLRRGIFFTALKKRWRVECGVKSQRAGASGSKLMAVPFRAKDVAAERTEFGHPDMAIVLTQLSYYYSGLSDEQLTQCFDILESSVSGPDGVYNGWIKKVPEGKILNDSIKTYNGINLQDYEQRTKWLFPVLRRHKGVVDFWLENVAFPKECKQFPGKLVTNAWDLCYERCVHATTGFSGTNDTSLLLPAQISQQDLRVLMDTNEEVEGTLKGVENEYRRTLRMGASCREVLLFMIEDGLRVLIDAGALMLELGNGEIAELWLELDKRLEGVVYFNERGEMVVKVRRHGYRKREKDQLLTLSCFRDRLERCGVYLDDQHTRGTDIRLPTRFKACVTVGSGMRRDKLIQACMRMRKLGKGQSVHFYLSHEVRNKIVVFTRCGVISVSDILGWVKWNSGEFEKHGLVFWATNGKNYAKNLACDDLFELEGKLEGDVKLLAERCQDRDAQGLEQMYGTFHHRVLLVELIRMWFLNIRVKLGGGNLPGSVVETLGRIEQNVLGKCQQHIPDQIQFHSMLEEEQEKELEPEQEEQVEKYRPPATTPLTPYLHPEVLSCVRVSGVPVVSAGICSLAYMFKGTSVFKIVQSEGWGTRWFVTQDFIKVVERREGEKVDRFLKSMRYFVSFKNKRMATCVLLVSQFEANAFIQGFRHKTLCGRGVLHMFSGRWMEGQSIFANNPRLQVPLDLSGDGRRLDEVCKAPLLVAAGNLYFDSMEEQKAFGRFLGLALRPWTGDHWRAFKMGLISSTGFVSRDCGLREGLFQRDPSGMVRGVLKVRNEVVRGSDHVLLMMERCAFLGEEG